MFLRAGFSFFSKSNFAFDLYHTENMFWFVGNEIGSFELYVRKSSDFVFRQKTRCFKLHNKLPVLLHGKRFFSSLQPVTLLLILLQRTFFICDWLSDYDFASFWLSYAVFSIIFVTTAPTAFSLFNS